jgi:hypothetical protein
MNAVKSFDNSFRYRPGIFSPFDQCQHTDRQLAKPVVRARKLRVDVLGSNVTTASVWFENRSPRNIS